MYLQNIFKSEAAMAIFEDAAARLRAMGVHCEISPMSLPQGMSVCLHAGATVEAATAASVASERGGEYAHAVGTSKQFAQMVQHSIDDAAADAATRPDYLAAMDREST